MNAAVALPHYTVSVMPTAPQPVMVMRLADQADLPVVGPTIAGACNAVLSDYLGRQPTWGEIEALTREAFGNIDMRRGGGLFVTVRERHLKAACGGGRRDCA